MTPRARGLAELFDLQRPGQDTWVGLTDGMRLPQLFVGQLVGQSIVAAGASVEVKSVHSVHTTFLRGGRSGVPADLPHRPTPRWPDDLHPRGQRLAG